MQMTVELTLMLLSAFKTFILQSNSHHYLSALSKIKKSQSLLSVAVLNKAEGVKHVKRPQFR